MLSKVSLIINLLSILSYFLHDSAYASKSFLTLGNIKDFFIISNIK